LGHLEAGAVGYPANEARVRRRIIVWTAVVVALAALPAIRGYRLVRLERGYSQIAVGTSRSAVVAALGRFGQSGPCEGGLWWDEQLVRPNHGECVEQLAFPSPFLPGIERWTVGFDSAGRVVSKYHYVSP
jgi:hypothetical protein